MILSLCIPTYKRPECIKGALDNYDKIIGENGLYDQVEVCISDNSDDDKTTKVVDEFIKKNKLNIQYRKNQENLGYDNNIVLAMKMAKGKYLQFMPDEVMYESSGLREIVAKLQTGDVDSAYLSKTHDMPELRTAPEFYDPNQLIHNFFSYNGVKQHYLAHILFFIIKNEDFQEFLSKYENKINIFYGLAFIQDSFIIYSYKKSKRVWIYKGMVEDPKKQTNLPKMNRAYFPSDTVRMNYYKYFFVTKYCHDLGIVSDAEYAYFKRNYFIFTFGFLFNARAHLEGEIYANEMPEINKRVNQVLEDYQGSIKGIILKTYYWVLFRRIWPLSILYHINVWYNRKIRGKKDFYDFFEMYENYKKQEADGLAARIYF